MDALHARAIEPFAKRLSVTDMLHRSMNINRQPIFQPVIIAVFAPTFA